MNIDLIWQNGHLAWPFFAVLVFSGSLILAADYVWRVVQMPASRLAACVGVTWLLGMTVIVLVAA